MELDPSPHHGSYSRRILDDASLGYQYLLQYVVAIGEG